MKKHIAFILLIAMVLAFAFSVSTIYAKSAAEVVKDFLKSKIVFDDFTKFKEAVDTGDGAKIFMCILEIYPDFVEEMKICSNDTADSSTATIITTANPMIVTGVGGVVLGVVGTLIVVSIKKKRSV